MSKLIIDPSASPIQPAFDPYWDKPMTRREAHVLFLRLAGNDNELMGMADTAALLINFICEVKLGIKDRVEVDAYVAVKKAQLEAEREKLKSQQGQPPDAQPNS